jgi:hypothetical protein
VAPFASAKGSFGVLAEALLRVGKEHRLNVAAQDEGNARDDGFVLCE